MQGKQGCVRLLLAKLGLPDETGGMKEFVMSAIHSHACKSNKFLDASYPH